MDPATWYYIAMLVLSAYMQYAMRPKTEHAKPPELGEFSVPHTEQGRDCMVIFGKVRVADFALLDYGNLRNEPPIKADTGK